MLFEVSSCFKIFPSTAPAHLIAFFSFHSINSSSFLSRFFSSFFTIYSFFAFSIFPSSHYFISPLTSYLILFSLITKQDIKIGRKSRGRFDAKEEETERKRVAEFLSIWEQYDWTQYA
jgi:hypothetical protein